MSPQRIWATAMALGAVTVLAGSPAFSVPGLWKGLPLGMLVTVMAANSMAMIYGVAEAPRQTCGRRR